MITNNISLLSKLFESLDVSECIDPKDFPVLSKNLDELLLEKSEAIEFLKVQLTLIQDELLRSLPYKSILESSDDAIISKDLDGLVTSWNKAAETIFGYTAREMIGHPLIRVFPPDRLDEENHVLETIKSGNKVEHFKTVRLHKNGSLINLSVTISPIFDHQNKIIGASKIARVIDDQIEAEKNALKLAAYTRHFEAIVESSDDAIISKNLDGIVMSWNKAAERIFKFTAEEMIGQSLLRIFPQNRVHEENLIISKIKSGQKVEHFRTIRQDRDGQQIHLSVTISPIYNESGQVIGASKIARDITSRVNSEKLIWHQANYDNLTALPNRRLFNDRLNQELRKAERDNYSIAVMFMDLDYFKDINDTLGHEAGDDLLIAVSKRLKELVRVTDTVARFGGDEFVILLSEINDLSDVKRIAESIVHQMQLPFTVSDQDRFISISLGISVYPTDGKTADDLLKHADHAMYDAKRNGRNQQKFYNPEMRSSELMQSQLFADMKDAMAQNQFELYFQPIVALSEGLVKKAEALIRWNHPVRGIIPPSEFISIAEDTGLIHKMGDWVFDEVLDKIKAWVPKFGQQFQISINKSPIQFHAHDSAEITWIDKMKLAGVKGENLVIEITESTLMNYSGISIQKLFVFKSHGIEIALDDFGTGYSSLSYLNKFEIDYLKIDKSFIRNLVAYSNEYVLCESIIVMAHKLGLEVIAEGVETKEQESLLKEMGCDYAQGYLYSKPLKAQDFEGFMINGQSASRMLS